MSSIITSYAPVTSEIEFLDCDPVAAAEAFEKWYRPLQAKRGMSLIRNPVCGGIREKIQSLFPLTSVEALRRLFVPTRGGWTAYLENGVRGNDASAVSHLSRVMECRAVRAAYVPDTIKSDTPGRYGSCVFELFSDKPIAGSPLNIQRSICSLNDGGKWKFIQVGEPLAFEKLDRYQSRRIQDRFDRDLLTEYLARFGIDFFSDEFYETSAPAILFTKSGPLPPGIKDFTLEQARGSF